MSTEKLSELSKPVAYSLRFRNMNGEPDKTINANTTFSTLEKAKAYGLGSRYVTQDDGKIVSVRDPSQDPIVEPLYSQEYVSALIQRAERLDSMLTESVQALKETEQKIAELEQAMHHIHGALLDITVPRIAIAKAAELAVEHALMKEQSNG